MKNCVHSLFDVYLKREVHQSGCEEILLIEQTAIVGLIANLPKLNKLTRRGSGLAREKFAWH